MWTQARPTLWRFGDAGNLGTRRVAPLLTHECITCLCCREEMEHDLDEDETPFRLRADASKPEVNRFAQDWLALHMFATLYYATERHQSAFAFLENGGMAAPFREAVTQNQQIVANTQQVFEKSFFCFLIHSLSHHRFLTPRGTL